nr:retrotransposon protein, putative, Ty1-copia subclass [Tanacetum cinerariifolium]
NKKAHSAVILCLGNKVLREVVGETTAAEVWSKLGTLYMTKSLANKLYLKKKLYTFYMPAGRKISEHIDEFNKIVLDLANIEDHLKRNYPKNNRKKSSGYVNKDDQPSSSGSIYDGSEVMSAEALLDWIMDSGGSYHMTPRLDLFSDFMECDGGKVLLGDNRECKIRGIAKVRLQLKDGSSFVLHNVRYIPELKRNMISLGTLEKEGYTVKLQSGKIKVINGSRIVLSRTRRDNCVYYLDGHAVAGEINASVEEKDSLAKVWHKRLGHISEAGLQVLEKQGLFGKKSLGKLNFYENCVLGKSHRVSFSVGRHTTHGVIDYVHSDLWGPSQVESLGAIEKKTPIKMWSGHPSDYGMLRTFVCVAYSHVQQGKLEPRAVKCVLLGYPGGVKGVTYKDTLKDSGASADKSVEELQVEVELQRLNNHTLEEDQTNNKDQTDQDNGDDEDAGDKEIDQPPDLIDYQLVRDREPRTRTKHLRFRDESNMAAYAEEEDTHEPLTYQEAVACEDNHQARQKLVTCKWLFKTKEGFEGVQKPRYKARLVARGFTQKAGIDYNEVFSPVVQHTSIRVILTLTACKDFELEQLDVKTEFLHGNLEEVIYMRQPPRYEQGNKVCLLKKSLYGLKQSPRQWYRRFDEYMLSNGFKRSSYDICVYYRSYAPGEYIYLLLYVDDMLIACKSKAEIRSTKSLLKREFDMKDLGEAKKILDNGKSVQMPLGGHFKLSLKDCPIRDCDVEKISKVPYANAVGSLMYLMVCTRPDITYAATLQHVVALSTTEAEYIDLTEAVKEAIWLRGLLEELGVELNRVTVNCDNQGEIHLSRNHFFHERTKHINCYKWYQSQVSQVVWLSKIDQEGFFVVQFLEGA